MLIVRLGVSLNLKHGFNSIRQYSSTIARTAKKGPFKILFCGSDEFSIASLKAVHEAKDVWESIHVLTPHESKVGRRGKKLWRKPSDTYTPALMTCAEELDVPTSTMPYTTDLAKRQRVRRKKAEGVQEGEFDDAADWLPPEPFTSPDPTHLLLTASFGYIIPNSVLANFEPEHRLNVHPSLLPRWRGAAPIQWTIANGDKETGVSVQRLVEKTKGIDGGEIVGVVREVPVSDNATYNALLPSLADTGGKLLVDTIRRIMADEDKATPQDESLKTRAPKIGKETAHIKWLEQDALQLERLSRGIGHLYPTWTELHGIPIQLLNLKALPDSQVPYALKMRETDHRPGTAWFDKSNPALRRLVIACIPDSISRDDPWDHLKRQGHSWAEVDVVRPEGKREMGVGDWWNGLPRMERNRNWVQFKGRRFLADDEEDGEEVVEEVSA